MTTRCHTAVECVIMQRARWCGKERDHILRLVWKDQNIGSVKHDPKRCVLSRTSFFHTPTRASGVGRSLPYIIDLADALIQSDLRCFQAVHFINR